MDVKFYIRYKLHLSINWSESLIILLSPKTNIMLFFFGTGSSIVLTEQVRNVSCTYCQQQDTVFITAISRYFHFFWIPVFPIGKRYYSQCSHCQQVLEKSQMPDQYKAVLAEISTTAKTPIWQFIGLILISIPILFGIISSIFQK